MAELTKEELASITKNVTDGVMASLKPQFDQVGELAKNQKILADTIKQLPPAQTEEQKTGESGKTKPEPVTAESIGKIVADQIAAAQKSQQASDQSRQQREQFIANRLKNFPPAYQNQLGNDPAKFEEEAKNIEQVFKTDATKFGWKAPSVGGENAGGQSPAAVKPDLSKLSASELIRMGVQQSKPGQQTAAA